MTSHVKPVGVALSSAHLTALIADRVLTARLNATGLPFAVAGIDRVDRAVPRSGPEAADAAVELSLAAATLAVRAPDLSWLAVAAAHRDQPYDLARRVASTGGLIQDLLPSVAAARVAAAAVRALWQDWSAEPVLAWRAESTGEAAAARGVADVLIWPAARPDRLAAAAAASSGGPRLFLEVPAGGDLGLRLARHLADERVAGVILRPAADEIALREFIAYVLPELAASGVVRTGWSGTLRERLSLPATRPLPARADAASAERVVVRVDHQLHPVP